MTLTNTYAYMYGSDTGRFHVGYNGYSNDHIPDSNTAAKDGHFIISHQTPETRISRLEKHVSYEPYTGCLNKFQSTPQLTLSLICLFNPYQYL